MKSIFFAIIMVLVILILLLKFDYISLTPQTKQIIEKSETTITKGAKEFAKKQVNKASEALNK